MKKKEVEDGPKRRSPRQNDFEIKRKINFNIFYLVTILQLTGTRLLVFGSGGMKTPPPTPA